MKAKQRLEFPLPLDLIPYLERYLAVWPLLLTGGGQHPPLCSRHFGSRVMLRS